MDFPLVTLRVVPRAERHRVVSPDLSELGRVVPIVNTLLSCRLLLEPVVDWKVAGLIVLVFTHLID